MKTNKLMFYGSINSKNHSSNNYFALFLCFSKKKKKIDVLKTERNIKNK